MRTTCIIIKTMFASFVHAHKEHVCCYIQRNLSMEFNGFFVSFNDSDRKICHVPLGEQNTPMNMSCCFFLHFAHEIATRTRFCYYDFIYMK